MGGSHEEAVIPYGRSRSRRRRSRSRSKSRGGSKKYQSERVRLAQEGLREKRLAKEHAAARVEAAVKAVEAAQKALESAIAADLDAASALQEMTKEVAKITQIDRIQQMVDEQE